MSPKEVDQDELRRQRDEVVARVFSERLPGWEAFLKGNAKAKKWIEEFDYRIGAAIRDGDEVLFERALTSWSRAWAKINHRIAEQYRKEHPDPGTWPLPYLKWMDKVAYIHFESELGEFLLYPQWPRKNPPLTHWYTADQMIAMLDDNVAATIKEFGVLPSQPKQLRPPKDGEKHMRVDLTGDEMKVTYELPRRKR